MKLTPHPILLSLSIRLLQVTAAISPPAAKDASKERFSARIRSAGPRRQLQYFESWMKGDLQRRDKNFYQTEGDVDFRERVSRSIWLSELRLSCDKLLLAGEGLFFGGEVFLLFCIFLSAGDGVSFVVRAPFSLRFLNAAFVGDPSVLNKTRKQRSVFSKTFQHGRGWLR